MKKNYTSPNIIFQPLSAAGLSAACSFTANHAANVCPIMIPEWGETVFGDYDICDYTPEDNVCYDVPTASSNVFES